MDEHLARMAEEFGDRTAFAVVDVGSLTFAEWDGQANAMARRLVEAGLGPAAGSASTCVPSWRCAGWSPTRPSTGPAASPCR